MIVWTFFFPLFFPAFNQVEVRGCYHTTLYYAHVEKSNVFEQFLSTQTSNLKQRWLCVSTSSNGWMISAIFMKEHGTLRDGVEFGKLKKIKDICKLWLFGGNCKLPKHVSRRSFLLWNTQCTARCISRGTANTRFPGSILSSTSDLLVAFQLLSKALLT